ncbi:MAG: hypothetical protein KJZ93_12360 [Caldilineaceae bacterium]|nr:hypothetical protein [Caldilineaceae bacterium]
MAHAKRRYIAYLLRLWPERQAGVYVWRASLEDPHAGQRQGFADLERLFSFLRAETTQGAEGDSSTAEPPSFLP